MSAAATSIVDLDRLLRLRLVVARFGEMDNAAWWNTKGMLGRLGKVALRRGFPKTHAFAQARAVFAVARHRCQEVFDPPKCLTLWKLPAEIEDEFEARWSDWIDEADRWSGLFEKLESINGSDLLSVFQGLELVVAPDIDDARKLKRSLDNLTSLPKQGVEGGQGWTENTRKSHPAVEARQRGHRGSKAGGGVDEVGEDPDRELPPRCRSGPSRGPGGPSVANRSGRVE